MNTKSYSKCVIPAKSLTGQKSLVKAPFPYRKKAAKTKTPVIRALPRKSND